MRLVAVLSLLLSSAVWAAPAVRPVSLPVPVASAPKPNLKSFKDWKDGKIQAAAAQVEQTKGQLSLLRLRAHGSTNLMSAVQNLEQQLSQEEWNLEVARDLSVTDYLVLYLAQQGSPAKLAEAAKQLSPEETAQVLEAYIRSMGGFPSDSKVLLPANALQTR
jgi:hypothetical protein